MKKDLIVSVALPYVAYLVLTHFGASKVEALLVGAIFPAASVIFNIYTSRRIDALGALMLGGIVGSVIGALVWHSPWMLLARSSFVTAAVGAVFALSLLARRPLIFYLMTGDEPEKRERNDALYLSSPAFRRMVRIMTVAWAIVLCAEAATRIVLIPLLPTSVFLVVSEAMWIAVFALMSAWSWRYGQTHMAQILGTDSEGVAAQ